MRCYNWLSTQKIHVNVNVRVNVNVPEDDTRGSFDF